LLYYITHRTEVEYNLMNLRMGEAERAWKDAFDAIREPIFLHDHNFRVVRANHAYAELTGMAFKDFIGRPYWEVFPKGEGPLPKCGAALQTDAALQAGHEQEEEFRLPDGRFFVSRAFYTTHPDGSFQYSVHVLEDMTERQQIMDELQISEARYRELFDNMLNGFALHEIILDRSGEPVDYRFLAVNPAFETITGLKGERIIGRTVKEVIPTIEPEWIERYGQVALTSKPTRFGMYSDALQHHFDVVAFCPAAGQFAVIIQDLSELQRENRLRRIISASNQALIRAKNEQELLDKICHIITEQADYRLAWVGLREEDARRTLRPVAAAGLAANEFNQLPDTWADTPEGRSAPAEAIRSGRYKFTRDVSQESICEVCQAMAEKLGYHSVLAIPLKDNVLTFGAITIAATAPDAFTDSEITLLRELAGDLAYGIVALRADGMRRAACGRAGASTNFVKTGTQSGSDRDDHGPCHGDPRPLHRRPPVTSGAAGNGDCQRDGAATCTGGVDPYRRYRARYWQDPCPGRDPQQTGAYQPHGVWAYQGALCRGLRPTQGY
jgi:PAS domain S-box-containing protein